jgi:hypothetical protein
MKRFLKNTALLLCTAMLFSFANKQKEASQEPTETGRTFWGWQVECEPIHYNPATNQCDRRCREVHYIFWIEDNATPWVTSHPDCPTWPPGSVPTVH